MEQPQLNQSSANTPAATFKENVLQPVAPEVVPAIRDRIIEEATRLFSEKGFNGVSVREIAEAVGVTKPTLYYYFASKEQLFESIITGLLEDFRKQLKEVVQQRGPVRDRLVEICRLYFDFARSHCSECRLLHSVFFSCDRNAIAFDFEAHSRTNLEMIRDVVAEGIGTKEIHPGDPWLMTLSFFGAIHLMVMAMLYTTDVLPGENLAESVVEQSLRGMGLRGSDEKEFTS